MNEDTNLVFSTANGNLISIFDLDVNEGTGHLAGDQLGVTNGETLGTLNGITGLSFTTGDGIADATMTFTGTLANINAAVLNGLAYAPTLNYNGAQPCSASPPTTRATPASGGTLTDADTVAITVGTSTSYYDAVWAETSLLNYFRMDDTSGTAIDDLETANNNGTYSGTPTLITGRRRSPATTPCSFDGTDDYVQHRPADLRQLLDRVLVQVHPGHRHDRAEWPQLRRHGRREHRPARTPTSASH